MYNSHEKTVHRTFLDIFKTMNFVSQHFFRIPHRFGTKWNFPFFITFLKLKRKPHVRSKNSLK